LRHGGEDTVGPDCRIIATKASYEEAQVLRAGEETSIPSHQSAWRNGIREIDDRERDRD
jgi:hypothetical protein